MSDDSQHLISWRHTDVRAPYQITAHDVKSIDLGRGFAVSAELRHPTLGIIGALRDHGNGGGPLFDSYDPSTFGIRDLVAYAQQCTDSGRPFGDAAVECVLGRMLEEESFERHVQRSRALGRSSVRYRDNAGPTPELGRSAVPLVHHDLRRRVLVSLPRKGVQGVWEVFTGVQWIPLDPVMARGTHTTAVHTAAMTKASADPLQLTLLSEHIDSVPPVFGEAILTTQQWCRCNVGSRLALTCMEFRFTNDKYAGRAWVHSARKCGALVMAE